MALSDYEYAAVCAHSTTRPQLAAAYRRHLSHQEVLEVVEALRGSHPAPTVSFVGKRSNYTPPSENYPAGHIRLGTREPGRVRLGTVLHELAHHVHYHEDKNLAPLYVSGTKADRRRWWHGPEFVAILDSLVSEVYT